MINGGLSEYPSTLGDAASALAINPPCMPASVQGQTLATGHSPWATASIWIRRTSATLIKTDGGTPALVGEKHLRRQHDCRSLARQG